MGTLDLAVMYIPSEAVYYHFISSKDLELFQYALKKKVIPSSPGHLYGFLASLVELYARTGLAGQDGSLEENQRILNCLKEMEATIERIGKLNDRIGGSMRTLNSNIGRINDEWSRLDVQLRRIREVDAETKAKRSGGEPMIVSVVMKG